jgi:NTP pyrophosphatase (non-canonical NTP hydrolase)
MTIAEYQAWQERTDLYNKNPVNAAMLPLLYTLGLNGEAGEVAEMIKRVYRDGAFDKVKLTKELGDVFWYTARLAAWAGISFQDVIDANVEKIEDRIRRNVGHGVGDDR